MATIDQSILNKINGTTGTSGSGTTKDVSSADAIQNRFLKLFTSQLQAQDPLNPMDNSQMTAQMSQISTVTGLEKLNQAMSGLTQAQMASQSLNAAALIGRNVLVGDSGLNLKDGSARGAVGLSQNADQLKIDVKDSKGNVVDSFSIEQPKNGLTYFGWDGKNVTGEQLADGEYSFAVTATQGGKQIDATALSYQQVKSVGIDGLTPNLSLGNGKRVTLDTVVEVAA
ncbi:flagellar hook assembly protein FlgD [Crenobacter cavernae]|uniref:Basal-body rod modification protein FlgD n=1 Tax=Crenobacter cavernae TaxID=2290923 RepID=A0ABY0FGH2_9NEIS|nr:flagellar hook capping FlgD N-terminal domain-containing protein [Crenobacter cavernae]RXZ44231.1 flagellar biosynthesis protein FlgD [Crenobacter cavernae]